MVVSSTNFIFIAKCQHYNCGKRQIHKYVYKVGNTCEKACWNYHLSLHRESKNFPSHLEMTNTDFSYIAMVSNYQNLKNNPNSTRPASIKGLMFLWLPVISHAFSSKDLWLNSLSFLATLLDYRTIKTSCFLYPNFSDIHFLASSSLGKYKHADRQLYNHVQLLQIW